MMTKNMRDTILMRPILNGADRLKIVTGYASHTMASWHLKEIRERFPQGLSHPVHIILIVGMTNTDDGLSVLTHEGLTQLVHESAGSSHARLTAQYVFKGAPVHSKLYLWEKEETPVCAYIGSANYTQLAFSPNRREIMSECEADDALRYFESIEADSIYCTHAEVENCIRIYQPERLRRVRDRGADHLKGVQIPSVKLSFLMKKDGRTGRKSGINWGQRKGREPNQAYIPLPVEIARSGFFPLDKQHFSVCTDDGKNLILRVEQQNNKAITTPLNNSLLGEYFRNRLGIANGAFVTEADFERYGRSDVTFYKLDNEQYYMDFSV